MLLTHYKNPLPAGMIASTEAPSPHDHGVPDSARSRVSAAGRPIVARTEPVR
jgi:hypothetical protein